MDLKCTFTLLSLVYKDFTNLHSGCNECVLEKNKVIKMKKLTIFSLMAIMAVGLVMTTGLASAYRGDYSVNGPEYSEERHTAMKQSFDTLDYDTWYELMTENGRHPRVLDIVTEDNFDIFVQAHDAGINGDYETAAELRAQLGLNNGNGPMDGTGYGKGSGSGRGMKGTNGEGRGSMKGNLERTRQCEM